MKGRPLSQRNGQKGGSSLTHKEYKLIKTLFQTKTKSKFSLKKLGWGLVRDSDSGVRIIIPIDILRNQTTRNLSLTHSQLSVTTETISPFKYSKTHFPDPKTQLGNPTQKPIYITQNPTTRKGQFQQSNRETKRETKPQKPRAALSNSIV